MADVSNLAAEFVEAACVPIEGGHGTGTLDQSEHLLRLHPSIATANIYTAAILGDEATVRQFLAKDPGLATTRGGPRNWDALTHLCFSRYLRLERARGAAFVRAAEVLLDGGASPNTGWYEKSHQPRPEWESVLYGAAGVAHHEALTALLINRGAEPNDGEVVYHAPEGWENGAMKVLVNSGKLTNESLTTMLLRKTDWHDYEGVKWLLEHGADPNALTHWGKTALHNALLSDNALEIIEVLLGHGADPTIRGTHPEVFRSAGGMSAVALAANRGRGDVLELFEGRGIRLGLQGVDRVIAACARNDSEAVKRIAADEPQHVKAVVAGGSQLLAQFAGNGNTEGVRHLLDLGVDIQSVHAKGDGYFGVAKDSTALHVAAWRARHATVRLLMERGARVNELDGEGRTALALAVRACVDSYWTERRSPESVKVLLDGGASLTGVPYPSGYAEVDELLKSHGATA
jgi:ankyrin repeat protein